jgi:hypothetical protein
MDFWSDSEGGERLDQDLFTRHFSSNENVPHSISEARRIPI